MSDDVSLPDKVSASFQQLKTAARELNRVSNELQQPVSALEQALQRLNLGISTWVKFDGQENQENGGYWEHQLGYSRVGGEWGIAIRATAGNSFTDELSRDEKWFFRDAPRAYRIKAVDKLPELLEKLAEKANSTTEKIRGKVERAQELVRAITGPPGPPPDLKQSTGQRK